jgi:hypothetical protein
MDVERFDADSIASENQAASVLIPERESEHSAQAGEGSCVPLQKGAKDNFRIAAREEAMAFGFELGAQFIVIVNLAVEDENGAAIIGKERLIAATKIDDFEPNGAEGDTFGMVRAALVRTTMPLRIGSYTNALSNAPARAMRKASYAAQVLLNSVS